MIRLRAYAFSSGFPLDEVAEQVIARTLRFAPTGTESYSGHEG
jgi:hypothetical protein